MNLLDVHISLLDLVGRSLGGSSVGLVQCETHLLRRAAKVLFTRAEKLDAKRRRKRWSPPFDAEFLFYFFLDGESCDALVGDLAERYRVIRKNFGKHRANFWYWKEAILSVGPVAWGWAKKTAIKPLIGVIAWAVAKGLLDRDSWLAALVEFFRRIRS